MEDKRWVWLLVTAVAPIAWGSVYWVTRQVLPHDIPLWGAALRALPAAVVLLLLSRRLPSGSWWWRSALLGILNVGGFFVLIFIAGTRLPSSLASSLMSTSAVAMMLFAWALLRQRPRLAALIGAVVGVVGVLVMFGIGDGAVDPWGVAASLGAMASSALGFVLTARWGADVPAIDLSAWQLAAGAIVLVPIAAIVEGPLPSMDGASMAGFAYVSLIATALAYVCWFTGLRRLQPAAVGVVGLLNPITGVVLGVALAGEAFGLPQGIGLALVLIGIVIGTIRPSRVAPAPSPTRSVTAPLGVPSVAEGTNDHVRR